MRDITVIWGDEDDAMSPRFYHTMSNWKQGDDVFGLLNEAMAAQLDSEEFLLASEQMTTRVLAIVEGHVEPLYLWDGLDVI